MSIPQWRNIGDPANPHHRPTVYNKRSPNTLGDFLLTGAILAIFALGLLTALLKQ